MKETSGSRSLEYVNYSPDSATVLFPFYYYFVTVLANFSLSAFWLCFCILFCTNSRAQFFLDSGMDEGKQGVTWLCLQGVLLALALRQSCVHRGIPNSATLFWSLSALLSPRALPPSYLCNPSLSSRGWLQNMLFVHLNCIDSGVLKNNCSIAVSSDVLMITVFINVIAS